MIALEEIQERLRAAIQESGISHKEIAAKLGVNPSTVSKYLHQNKFPALDTFANLCAILDVSSDEILGIKQFSCFINNIKRNFGEKELTFSDGIKAIIDNKDAEELTHKADARKTTEISLLNEIVENAVFENEIDIAHKKFSKMRYYVAKTRLKDKNRTIWLNIGLEKNGSNYHIYDIVPPKK